MGVEPKIGVGKPPKWMVYFMENSMNKWMIWGVFPPLFLVQHPYIPRDFSGNSESGFGGGESYWPSRLTRPCITSSQVTLPRPVKIVQVKEGV